MRIGIVNDVPVAVEALRRVVSSCKNYEVAWIAVDGRQAVEMAAKDRPDLILMDLIMPVMDGVEATRIIMEKTPCSILVVTATVDGNISKVFDAMGHGALDAVNTPTLGNPESVDALLKKINVMGRLINPNEQDLKLIDQPGVSERQHPYVVAVGASTGGPQALATVLGDIPADCGAAFVVVQHVDRQFSQGLADWLNEKCTMRVVLAADGETLVEGRILLAGRNDHLAMHIDGKMHYTAKPEDYPYRPSVDVLFATLAEHCQHPGTAVLLTGMGRDGAEGMLAAKNRNWHTIAQDKDSCVVFGMPKAAIALGAAEKILPLDMISNEIKRNIRLYSGKGK